MARTQPDYGVDIVCIDDLDPLFRMTSGLQTVQQALIRRLQSPLGSLFRDPRYGFDLRGTVGSATAQGANAANYIAGLIRTQVLMDERVASVEVVRSAYDAAQRSVSITLTVYTSAGPFGLVLELNANNLSIIAA